MQKHDIDAILIFGAAQHNPAMVYFTGGGHVTNADLIKKRGEKAILFHASMERDEAAKSGLATRSYDNYPIEDLIKQAGGNYVDGLAFRYKKMLEETFGFPVKLWDERLTTMAAERMLIEADVSRKKRKKVIDKMAAVMILQGYLDSKGS